MFALGLLAAGCGSSGSSSQQTSGSPATQAAATVPSGPPTKPFKVTVVADTHAPAVGTPWHYTIRAKNADGTAVTGTAMPAVFQGNTRLDGIGWFGFSGIYKGTYTWKSEWRGKPLDFVADVQANGGVESAKYAITVQ